MLETGYQRWRAAWYGGVLIGAVGILAGDRAVITLAPAGLLLMGCGVAALRSEPLRAQIRDRLATSGGAYRSRWSFTRFHAWLILVIGVLWALLGFAEGLT